MATIKAGNIRKGMHILFKNVPHQVTKADFMSPGKGSAFMRAKLKNAETGFTQEFTFKSTEQVEEIEVSSNEMQFLYADDTEAVFMNQRSFEQLSVPIKLVEEAIGLLTSETKVYVLVYDDKAIGVSLPPKMKLKVTQAENAVAGNTVGQARKEAELETGLKIQVPLFVKTGDTIVVDTATKQYVTRA